MRRNRISRSATVYVFQGTLGTTVFMRLQDADELLERNVPKCCCTRFPMYGVTCEKTSPTASATNMTNGAFTVPN